MLASLIIGFLKGLIGPITQAISDIKIQALKSQVEGFQNAVQADTELGKAFLNAQIETNKIKLAQQASPGMRRITIGAGTIVLIYFGAIVGDSIGHFGWNIAKLPPPWDGYAWIILQSFVVLTPAQPLISAAAAWLSRR
ncbi:hypothetical protein [Beijerinckia indica]|uniref:Uncharacterized protein n=1 Tax=Beijerinckia indica subsp. indica (strain ATCC 9039 / DSM 1715 / NCIMB 8712) TaxID=395963 RepID=B2IDZ8_BEII9|nr:hypothetical protein [Beijerinckia indica]ACB96929.1 hypothetical protein Bind_3372 [Beijerinckia indica subsp. indica ATCC 9039]